MVNKVLFHKWHWSCWSRQQPLICHTFLTVVVWMTIRLHQSNQAHSTTWQVLFICKYQIHSIFHVVFYNEEGIVQIIFTLMSLYYYIWISNVIYPGLYCLFCWYWYNCSPSCLKLSFHNHISHRIVEYKKEYSLNIFMFCKLQYGIPEGIWYLESSMSCLEIRTKYNDNLRPNKYTLYPLTYNQNRMWICERYK
jgi:hypothetical protein